MWDEIPISQDWASFEVPDAAYDPSFFTDVPEIDTSNFVTPDAPYADYSSAVDFAVPTADFAVPYADYASQIDTSGFVTPEAPYQTEQAFDFAKTYETGKDYLTNALKRIGAVTNTKEGLGLGKNAFPMLALAQGMLSSRKASQEPAALRNQLMQATAGQRAVGEQLLNQYQSGQIGAAAKSQIDQMTAAQVAAIKQRYAQMGRNPETDSAAQNEIAMAQQRQLQLYEQARQGILQQGLQAAGMASGPVQNAVLQQYQANKANEQNMYNLLLSLARMQQQQTAEEQKAAEQQKSVR